VIPGETSTGSKRAGLLFGPGAPSRLMTRSAGCRLWDDRGREYVDMVMALGAVALGYGHAAVVAAAERAVRDGTVGSFPPIQEARLAERLTEWIPGAEAVRFLKTGAEAVAAAVRIARVHTGRSPVITCGYHGWLDWCSDGAGVPEAVRALRVAVPFNDIELFDEALAASPPPAAIVIEPVVERAPTRDWLEMVRKGATRVGAVLIFDEIKTGIRLGKGGAARRYGGRPDLVVVGKALGNGFPIAAVAGPATLMEAATRTWISSTLATEFTALAAAEAVLEVGEREGIAGALAEIGARWKQGLETIAGRHPAVVTGVIGIPEMCSLTFRDEALSATVAMRAADLGLLFKRSAYNFVSLAHDDAALTFALDRLETAVAEVARRVD
jgi:glutamate-1-semialdehyde 2,1-aminomutase